jgi:cyclic pyranopterin phosphate synthase
MQAPQNQPISLRISVTDRCQYRCAYCTTADGDACTRSDDLLGREEIIAFVRMVAGEFGLSKVHLTGGEPLLRREIVRLIRMLRDAAVPDIALTTNGQLLEELAVPLRRAGLDRVNVSVDSLDPATYRELNGVDASLERTLRGVDAAMSAGLAPVKINTVLLRGRNLAEVPRLVRWAAGKGCQIRFIELMPLGCIADTFSELYASSQDAQELLERDYRLQPVPKDPGSSSREFRVYGDGGELGRVGFISSMSHPFCEGCRRLRLMSDGRLLGCLKDAEGVQIHDFLRSPLPHVEDDLTALLHQMLSCKGTASSFDGVQTLLSRGG